MKKVTLLFPTIEELLLFKETTHSSYIVTVEEEKKLICECSETDIRLAINMFNARVIESCEDENN